MASSATTIAKRLNEKTFLGSSEFSKVLEEYFADSEDGDSDVDNVEHEGTDELKQMETEEADEGRSSFLVFTFTSTACVHKSLSFITHYTHCYL